jgi:hypothetical protein
VIPKACRLSLLGTDWPDYFVGAERRCLANDQERGTNNSLCPLFIFLMEDLCFCRRTTRGIRADPDFDFGWFGSELVAVIPNRKSF